MSEPITSFPGRIMFAASEVATYYAFRLPHLRQRGREWRCPCPLHHGKRDSFAVSAETGDAYCHSKCGRGWDLIGFEMERTGEEFRRAKAEVFRIVGRSESQSSGKIYYTYVDENGYPLHRTVRAPGKRFWQEHFEGDQWIRGKGSRLVLYRLKELQARTTETIHCVEGERDADRLHAHEYLATTNPMGAGKWRAEFADFIRGRDVVLFYDIDDASARFAGQVHAADVGTSLLRAGCRVRLVHLPEHDVSDFLDRGHTKADLDKLIADAPYVTAEELSEWLQGVLNSRSTDFSEPREILETMKESRPLRSIGTHGTIGNLAIKSVAQYKPPKPAAQALRNQTRTDSQLTQDPVECDSETAQEADTDWLHAGLDGTEEPDPLPRICINGRQLRDISDDALRALQHFNREPVLFACSGFMVAVSQNEKKRYEIKQVDEFALRARMTRTADFFKVLANGKQVSVSPPMDVVRDIQAQHPQIWQFPAIIGITECPVLRPDGTVLSLPGYDAATGLFHAPVPGLQVPEVPMYPTRADALRALNVIQEMIQDFPFVDAASQANMIGALMTPIVRSAVKGATPLALIDAPVPGSGKSLLADLVSIIATGHEGEMFSAPKNDEEWRKQITMGLKSGTPIIIFDNVAGRLDNPDLCKALTETYHADRTMRTHDKLTLPVRCAWIATGNNVQVSGDMPRRCYWIRIDPKRSDPFLRSNFNIQDLPAWAKERRGELLASVLTIARAWFVAGKPLPIRKPLGSFESWSTTIGGMLEFIDVSGFLGNATVLYEDTESLEWEAFLQQLHETFYGEPFTVAELVKTLQEQSYDPQEHRHKPTTRATEIRQALPSELAKVMNSEGSVQHRLGQAFASRLDTRFGQSQIHLGRSGTVRRAQLWKVVV